MEESFVHAEPVVLNEKEMKRKEEKKTSVEEAAEIKNKLATEDKRKVYDYNEVIKSAREYFGGDDLAAKVWASKYALKDSFGKSL